MFVKKSYSTKAKRQIPYYQLVQSYREGKKVKHRVLANLGPLSDAEIDQIIHSLNRLKKNPYLLDDPRFKHRKQFAYGDAYLISAFWHRLDLVKIIQQLLGMAKVEFDVAVCAQLMVINRCVDPKSKLALHKWQHRIYFDGQKFFDYHQILRALDHLERIRDQVEAILFQRQIDLFNQRVDLVFYDVTSTYFEGRGPGIACKGYSRDGKPGKNQIILALAVTKGGLPIGHEVYEGNRKDSTTVVEMVQRLKQRFKIDKCIFVGDRGMVSQDNIRELDQQGYEYIFALRKRRLLETREVIEPDLTQYQQIKIRESGQQVIKLYYLEVQKDNIRYVVCHNPQVASEELDHLEKRLQKKEQEVKNILVGTILGTGNQKPEAKIRRIARIYDINRYIRYGIRKGKVWYEPNQDSLTQERLVAGKYILKTSNFSLNTLELIEAYKNLSDIERAFRTIKSFVEIRPMNHRDELRVRGHVFMCVLAYYIQKVIDLELKKARCSYSAIEAIEEMGEIKLIESTFNGQQVYQSIEPNREHKIILKACGVECIPEAVFKEQ